jgi:polyferredoxin
MVIRQIPYLDFAHVGIVALAVGRMACGWLCPLGLIQDLLYTINTVKIKLYPVLFNIKYFSLFGLAMIIPYFTGVTWFSRLCPYGMLEAGLPWVLWNPVNPHTHVPAIDTNVVGLLFVVKFLILVVFLTLFVFSKRPFCRIACPLGVIFSVFNRISLLQIEVLNPEKCGHKCNLCLEVCPMEIRIADDPNSGECIRCLKCMKCRKVKVGIGNIFESPSKPKPVDENPG